MGTHRHIGTVAVIMATLLTAPPTAHANHLDLSRRKYGAIMADDYYDTIHRCEVGNAGWDYNSRTYTGGLGIHKATAYRWSGRRNLATLTPRQQVRIADRIAFSGWTNKAGTYVWPVGPFGWGTVRHGCGALLEYLCKSTHPRVQKYRARACRLWGARG